MPPNMAIIKRLQEMLIKDALSASNSRYWIASRSLAPMETTMISKNNPSLIADREDNR